MNIQPRTMNVTAAPEAPQRQPDTAEAGSLVEATAPEAPKAPEADPLSSRFAKLAQQEKRILRQAQELKAREEAWKAKEEEYTTSYIPKSALQERLKDDPLGLMMEHGVTYDQLTQAILNQPNAAQDMAFRQLQSRIEELAKKQTQSETQIQEQQQKARDQAVNQIRSDAKIMISADPSKFEMIASEGAEEAVVELITETFDSEGRLLSVEEAADEVENFLFERAFKQAQSKKVKDKLAAALQAQAPAPVVNQQKSGSPIKTLTNAMTASAPTRLTDKQRRERAILAGQGKLIT